MLCTELVSNTLYCFYHDIAKLIIRFEDVSRFTISSRFFHFLFRWHEMTHSKLILPERNGTEQKRIEQFEEKNSTTLITSMSMTKNSKLQSILKGFPVSLRKWIKFMISEWGSFPLFYVFNQNTVKIPQICNKIVS